MKSNSTQSGISKELQLPISQQVTTIASNSPIYFYQYNLKVNTTLSQIITPYMQIIPRFIKRNVSRLDS